MPWLAAGCSWAWVSSSSVSHSAGSTMAQFRLAGRRSSGLQEAWATVLLNDVDEGMFDVPRLFVKCEFRGPWALRSAGQLRLDGRVVVRDCSRLGIAGINLDARS